MVSEPKAPSASSEDSLVTRDVSSILRHLGSMLRSSAAESGRVAVAESVSKERVEVQKDLDLLEKLARESQGPGSHTRVNLAPDAPRRPDGNV